MSDNMMSITLEFDMDEVSTEDMAEIIELLSRWAKRMIGTELIINSIETTSSEAA